MFIHALNRPQDRGTDRPRTLIAKGDAVWIWPGIPLTVRRGDEIIPAPGENIRFWITRLHGPEALDKEILRAVAIAADHLKLEKEDVAQQALDALGLNELSQDGATLMRALINHLDVEAPDLPLRATMRSWNDQDIERHPPIYKGHLDAVRILMKGAYIAYIPNGSDWDPQKPPRWPAGAPDSQGGEFAPADSGAAAIIPVVLRPRQPKRQPPPPNRFGGPPPSGDNTEPPKLEVPQEKPPSEKRYGIVKEIGYVLNELAAENGRAKALIALSLLVGITWLRQARTEYYYQLRANLDLPKTLKELQDAVATPTLGYQIHHIVELESGPGDGVTDKRLLGRANEVRIPEMKHRLISNWYSTPNDDFKISGQRVSPREYLRDKGWEERYRLGIQKLIDFGVLKP